MRRTPSDCRELEALRHLCHEDLPVADLAPPIGQRLAADSGADGYCLLVLDPAALVAAAPATSEAVLTLDPEGRVEAVSTRGDLVFGGLHLGEQGVPLAVMVMVERVRLALRQGGALTGESLAFVDPRLAQRYEIRGQVLDGVDGRPRGLVLIRPLRTLDDPRILARLGLTRREIDVVLASVRGFTTAGTASFLGLSPHTVEHHLKNVYAKLGVTSRSELTALIFGV